MALEEQQITKGSQKAAVLSKQELNEIFLIMPCSETKMMFSIFMLFVCKFDLLLKFPRDDTIPAMLIPFSPA